MVRVFADDDVVHVDGKVDPKSDIEVIETELILADLQTLEKAVPRLEKEARTNKDRGRPRRGPGGAGDPQRRHDAVRGRRRIDSALLRELNLMTTKPFLYVFNADEAVLTDAARVAELREMVAPADAVFLDAKIEAELQELDDESAAELLESIGQTERGLDALARAGFHTLRLQTYPDGRAQGVAGLDDPPGRHRAEGRRRHPHRFREGLHQGRDRVVRRPDRRRLDGRGQGRGQGAHRRQGLRDGRRRRGRVPVSSNVWPTEEVVQDAMIGRW